MTDLKNKKALFIGTGKMGLPTLVGFLKHYKGTVDPNDITVISGTSAGKDIPAVCQALRDNGFSQSFIDQLHLFPRDTVTPELVDEFDKQDCVFLNVVPGEENKTINTYLSAFHGMTQLITPVAGKEIKKYKKIPPMNIARIMPHIPMGCYGVYAPNENTFQTARAFCTGLGEPVRLNNEERMHGFTAVAGSGPAFITHFVSSFKTKDEQQYALRWLHNFATQSWGANPSKPVEKLVADKCMEFYNNYRAVAEHYLGKESAAIAVNQTLRSTVEDLQKGQIEYSDYIKRVRTPRGTTNAGLIFMGSAPPDTPNFGNTTELVGQQSWANACKAFYRDLGDSTTPSSIDRSESIIYAVVAAAKRSAAIAEHPDDPIGGIVFHQVTSAVQKIKQKLAAAQQGNGKH